MVKKIKRCEKDLKCSKSDNQHHKMKSSFQNYIYINI